MSRGIWEGLQNDEHPPVWDLLEVLERGPNGYPRYVSFYPAESERNRVALLLAGLALGPPVATVLREHLSRRDSREKWFLAVGLGEMGHPEVEGYFARVLRERVTEGAMVAAVRALGRIRGPRSLPLVISALQQPALFESACAALASYGGPEAEASLLSRAAELPALRALAQLGARKAVPLFREALRNEPPWPVVGALGIGRGGHRDLAPLLLPLLESDDGAVAQAAFEAYARLGAPEGVGLLLRLVPESPPEWMVAALGGLDHPAVQELLVGLLSPPARRGLLGRFFPRRKKATRAEPSAVYRALRRASELDCLRALAVRLEQESEPKVLREITGIQALAGIDEGRSALTGLWRREELPSQYFAARALLQSPDETFLAEALSRLASPGFKPEEAKSPLWDEGHALSVHAQDNGACVFVAALLDAGLIDLGELEAALSSRFCGQAWPSDEPPTRFLSDPVDRSTAVFLRALAEASPGIRELLFRLVNLVAETTSGGESLLDLGLCVSGVHHGGVHRTLYRGFPSALGKLLEGRDDRFLPNLSRLASRLPAEGPFRSPLLALFEKARRVLMAECRDMSIYSEGSPRGDMVLVEQLRSGS